jgi:hypothetical protein
MNTEQFNKSDSMRKYNLITLSLIGKKDIDIKNYNIFDEIVGYRFNDSEMLYDMPSDSNSPLDKLNNINLPIDTLYTRMTSHKNKLFIQKTIQLYIFYDFITEKANFFLKEYEYNLNVTFSDIISSDFCQNRTGFTGTPYFTVPFDISNDNKLEIIPKEDIIAEGSIMYSILKDNVQVFCISTKNYNTDIFNILIKNEYNVLIDIGAYFLNYSNKKIATIILEKLKVDKCIYLDTELNDDGYAIEKDIKMYCYKEGEQFIYKKLYKSDNFKSDKIFIYFDQRHITGIDIPQIPINSRGLILIKNTDTIRDYSQGAFRLRKINVSQSIDICVNEILFDKIKESDSNNNNNIITCNKVISDIKCREKLINILKDNENNYKDEKIKLQAIHNIRSIYRYSLIRNNVIILKFPIEYKNLGINIFAISNILQIT